MNQENARAAKRVLDEQVKAIADAKAKGIPIITVEYEGDGATDDRIKNAIGDYSKKHTVLKSTDGVFQTANSHKNDLAAVLKKYNIGNLIVTGANGGACVFQSVAGALKNGCSVTTVSNAIADFNFNTFMYPYQFAEPYTEKFQEMISQNCPTCKFKQVYDINDLSSNEIPPEDESSTAQ